MIQEITPGELELWFSGKYHHAAYEETVELARKVRVHADGIYPDDLIEKRRPNESEEVQEYRKEIWKAITKPYLNKVFTSLNKIRRSPEWSIKFDPGTVSARVIEEESLESYLLEDFPYFTSITNWAFSLLLREQGIDANAWIVVMPVEHELEDNEYLRPYPFIYRSDQIIEPREDLLVVISDEKVAYTDGETERWGDRYYVVTDEKFQIWDQTGIDRNFTLSSELQHNLGELPAFKLKGVVKSAHGKIFINESRLAPMLERFDEAAREYSDLQADVVQHIYNEKWEMGQADDDCTVCKGLREVTQPGFKSQRMTCGACNGTGFKPRGPFTVMKIRTPMAGENAVPNPPMGYLQKDTNIIELQDKRIDKHIYHGLAAVNMEFLAEKPLDQSGIAKAMDGDETNNYVHSWAEDIVAILDLVAYFTNELRYQVVVPNYKERVLMLPAIAVPETFDLFSAQILEQSVASAKTNKLHPVIINALEVAYATKKFSSEPEIGEYLQLILSLDPLAGVSEDDKMLRAGQKWVSQQSLVISANIQEFVNRALEEIGIGFYGMETKDQKALMVKYAQGQIDATSTVSTLLGPGETSIDQTGGGVTP
jgi:hypothetical protein